MRVIVLRYRLASRLLISDDEITHCVRMTIENLPAGLTGGPGDTLIAFDVIALAAVVSTIYFDRISVTIARIRQRVRAMMTAARLKLSMLTHKSAD